MEMNVVLRQSSLSTNNCLLARRACLFKFYCYSLLKVWHARRGHRTPRMKFYGAIVSCQSCPWRRAFSGSTTLSSTARSRYRHHRTASRSTKRRIHCHLPYPLPPLRWLRVTAPGVTGCFQWIVSTRQKKGDVRGAPVVACRVSCRGWAHLGRRTCRGRCFCSARSIQRRPAARETCP